MYKCVAMPVIAIVNQKGGVAKTTLATSLAVVFAETHTVMLLDADALINDNKVCRPVASLRNVTETLAPGVPPRPVLIPALQEVPAQGHRPQRRPALWP